MSNIKNNIFLKLFPVTIVAMICLKESKSANLYSLVSRYIDVPVDHFASSPTSTTFRLRYLITLKNYNNGGPVFVYTGGEREITIAAQNTGFLFEISPIFNASVVFIEHRYYGQSLPFGNGSFSTEQNLRYLSTIQVLADFALLIDDLKKTVFHDAEPHFIAFGGYYAGMLSAWFRLKYPHLVSGAITSSAPILYFPELTSCEGYYRTVTRVFEKYGGERCIKTIKQAWDILIHLTQTKFGMNYISSAWNLCSKLRTTEDVETLLDWLANIYTKLSMVNYPYPSEYFEPVPSYPVMAFCDKLTSAHFKNTREFIESFANALKIYTNYTGKTVCNNIYNKQQDPNEIAWQYQTCTELIMPKCSTDEDMFITKEWNYKQFIHDCYNKFGVRSRSKAFMAYGGKNVRYYSKTLFSNSMLSPGSWGGVYLNTSDIISDNTLLTYQIVDAPHLMDLRGSDTADNNNILNARQFYISILKKWLSRG